MFYDNRYFRGCVVGGRAVDSEGVAGSDQVRSPEYNRVGRCSILQCAGGFPGFCLSGGPHRRGGTHHLGDRQLG